MSSILYRINGVLSRVVASVPIGTNLGLFHLLWMLLSGRLLQSRGAVIPGLADLGLAADAVRRCWAALAYGKWHASQLLEAGSNSSARKAASRPTNTGAIARWPVMWSASFVRVFRTVRPSTTRPQQGRRYQRSPWGSRPGSGRSVPSVSPCPASWCEARGPRRVKPPCKPACSRRSR